jgi:hypothetical protein
VSWRLLPSACLPVGGELLHECRPLVLQAVSHSCFRPAWLCSEENAEVLQGTVLELLRSMIEEADDLPQQQLDILLARLLPAAAAESPAAHALVVALLQRTETTVQPHLQKFLKALLTGVRTDSELKDDAYELFYAVCHRLDSRGAFRADLRDPAACCLCVVCSCGVRA